jgi:hypothetical protein
MIQSSPRTTHRMFATGTLDQSDPRAIVIHSDEGWTWTEPIHSTPDGAAYRGMPRATNGYWSPRRRAAVSMTVLDDAEETQERTAP